MSYERLEPGFVLGMIREVNGGPIAVPSEITYRVAVQAGPTAIEWPFSVIPSDRRFDDSWEIDTAGMVGKPFVAHFDGERLRLLFGHLELPAAVECDTTGGGP